MLLTETEILSGYDIAEKVRLAIDNLNILHAYSKASDHISVSVGGITFIPDKDSHIMPFSKKADDLLYQVKESGRKKVVWSNLF